MMKATQLKESRLATGLTQAQLAKKLGKSQGYVSLVERGLRSPSMSLAERLAKVLDLPPTARPLRVGKRHLGRFGTNRAAKSLAALGYSGFAYMGESRAPTNPTTVLLKTLASKRVDARLVEAMPWLLLRFSDFDRQQTVELAYRHGLQNRLGFVVALAKSVAERHAEYAHRLPELNKLLSSLEPLRLAREDDLGQPLRSERLREWIRDNRSEAAIHWNVLTDLGTEHLSYVN
jgi:transcriptional regulator with XRE-family HTH domain